MGKSKISPKTLEIWLTKAQRTQVKQTLGVDLPQGRVPLGPSIQMKYGFRLDHGPTPPPVMKYALPLPSQPGAVRLYFTDQQKQRIRSAGGQPCDFAEIKPTMTLRYGLFLSPPPKR